jgi:elongation factor G
MLLRETIRKTAEGEGEWVRIHTEPTEYAHVDVRVEPLPRGSGIKLDPAPPKGHFPDRFIPGVEQGLLAALASGAIARCEVTDLLAVVTNGSYHEQDSSLHAFEKAAEEALRKAIQAAEPFVLEPLLHVTIKVPEEFVGVTVGLINRCEGAILDIAADVGGKRHVITAQVPEREFHDLERDLSPSTQKSALVSFTPAGYQELRPALARLLRYCSACERKVLPKTDSSTCPDCGASLGSDDYYNAV